VPQLLDRCVILCVLNAPQPKLHADKKRRASCADSGHNGEDDSAMKPDSANQLAA
jgi:hypothetical protein